MRADCRQGLNRLWAHNSTLGENMAKLKKEEIKEESSEKEEEEEEEE